MIMREKCSRTPTESVAEIAEKPLYRVTCGDIGTRADDVEKYLQTVLYLGKIWNCGKSEEIIIERAQGRPTEPSTHILSV